MQDTVDLDSQEVQRIVGLGPHNHAERELMQLCQQSVQYLVERQRILILLQCQQWVIAEQQAALLALHHSQQQYQDWPQLVTSNSPGQSVEEPFRED